MAKLPNVFRGHIPMSKLTGYLLNKKHPQGGPKALFFESMGFNLGDPQTLAFNLWEHAADHDVAEIELTEFSWNYVIIGSMHTPCGETPLMKAVWSIDRSLYPSEELRDKDGIPSLVTAYPAKRGKV
jgi:hypothetical protein